METFLRNMWGLYASIFSFLGPIFKFLVKRWDIDKVKMSSSFMSEDLVWDVENSS